MKAKDLREKSDEELIQSMHDEADKLMHFRLQMATGVVENVRSARFARRDIARMKTVLKERQMATVSAATSAQGEQ